MANEYSNDIPVAVNHDPELPATFQPTECGMGIGWETSQDAPWAAATSAVRECGLPTVACGCGRDSGLCRDHLGDDPCPECEYDAIHVQFYLGGGQ